MKREAIQYVYVAYKKKKTRHNCINCVGNTEIIIRVQTWVLALITESLCHTNLLSGLQPFCASDHHLRTWLYIF